MALELDLSWKQISSQYMNLDQKYAYYAFLDICIVIKL